MSNYKIGEKIAFYNNGCRFIGIIEDQFQLVSRYSIRVPGAAGICSVHEKQIRRLKPKSALRTFWVNISIKYATHSSVAFRSKELAESYAEEKDDFQECIEVREVVRKKK